MTRPPDVIVVFDGTRLLSEPSSLNIPVVAVVDSDLQAPPAPSVHPPPRDPARALTCRPPTAPHRWITTPHPSLAPLQDAEHIDYAIPDDVTEDGFFWSGDEDGFYGAP